MLIIITIFGYFLSSSVSVIDIITTYHTRAQSEAVTTQWPMIFYVIALSIRHRNYLKNFPRWRRKRHLPSHKAISLSAYITLQQWPISLISFASYQWLNKFNNYRFLSKKCPIFSPPMEPLPSWALTSGKRARVSYRSIYTNILAALPPNGTIPRIIDDATRKNEPRNFYFYFLRRHHQRVPGFKLT